jgi:hypothetical protein
MKKMKFSKFKNQNHKINNNRNILFGFSLRNDSLRLSDAETFLFFFFFFFCLFSRRRTKNKSQSRMIPTTILLFVASIASVSLAQRTIPPASPCVTCATPNTTAYFDGCNRCSCAAGSTTGACTKIACERNDDPTVCTGKCDGFIVPSDDGCGSCTCKDGKQTRCSSPDGECKDPCSAVTCASGKRCVPSRKDCVTTPCPQFDCVADEGAFKCGCNGDVCSSGQSCNSAGRCVDLPFQNWFADGAPFCVRGGGGRCCGDNLGASCGAGDTCVDGACVPASRVDAACSSQPSQCFTCKTPGVKSYFDGCNQCSCTSNGDAACTDRACITLAHDPKQCVGHCDGFLTEDDGECGRCTCINGEKTKCSKCGVGSTCKLNADGKSKCTAVVPPDAKDCGCANPANKCERGETCLDNKCQVQPPAMIPAGAADGTPICLRAGGSCCGAGFLCQADEVCESNECIKAAECSTPNTCFTCKTPGVKSYTDGCNQCTCDEQGNAACTERACVALAHDPKQCAGHCDGFLTEDDGECGRCTCVNGEKTKCSKCGVGAKCTTANGKSKCSAVVPPKPCDASPCAIDETCVDTPKQCITTPCPQYDCVKNDGKCYTCATPGIRSFYDGCNNCACTEDNERGALCTLLACVQVVPDAKQCTSQCDGFVTEDDGMCGRCLCIGGKKTKCSNEKCSGGAPLPAPKCTSCNSGSEECKNAVVPKGDECNTCKCVDGKSTECTSRRCSAECKGVNTCAASGQICVAEPKQCLTTPCDQYACVDIGSAAARADEMRFDDTDSASTIVVAWSMMVGVLLILM